MVTEKQSGWLLMWGWLIVLLYKKGGDEEGDFLNVLLTSKYGDRSQSVSQSVRSNWKVVREGDGLLSTPSPGKGAWGTHCSEAHSSITARDSASRTLEAHSRCEGTCLLALATWEWASSEDSAEKSCAVVGESVLSSNFLETSDMHCRTGASMWGTLGPAMVTFLLPVF